MRTFTKVIVKLQIMYGMSTTGKVLRIMDRNNNQLFCPNSDIPTQHCTLKFFSTYSPASTVPMSSNLSTDRLMMGSTPRPITVTDKWAEGE